MVLLLAHSHYSLLTAPSTPRALCEEAVRLGHEHLVLTDLNGLYGFLPFAREARRVGLHAVFGVELVHAGRRLWAIAQNQAGYRSACRLVTARHLDADFELARAAAAHADGLLFVCGDLPLLSDLHGRLPPDRLWVALPPRGTRPQMARDLRQRSRKQPDPASACERQHLVEAAATLGRPLVAVREVWFARAAEHRVHLLFMAVKWNLALGEGEGELRLRGHVTAQPSMHLPDRAALAAGHADHPEAAARARALLASCTLALAENAAPVFPTVALPAGRTPADHLRRLTEAGLARRYDRLDAAKRGRMQHELTVIEATGFSPYFLVVHEIVGLARARGIPLVGRGSAADSLVAYGLGLTEADPLRYGLLFERFLNPARHDRPDIDLDFCWRRRDELLAAVYEHFGHDHVAMIATYTRFGPRAAYREAARVLGLPPAEIARRTRLLPHHLGRGRSLVDLIGEAPGFFRRQDRPDSRRERALRQGAGRLLQAPRHLGVHPCGLVITPGPIAERVPLERAAKGLVVTQFDMRLVEELGLVKIDLLGNRALTILDDSRAILRRLGRQLPDLEKLPENDRRTAELLREGRTLGCFQVESPAMRTLLRQLRAASMDRVIQAVALIRPGPSASGMKESFVRRVQGLEPVQTAHPLLAEVFADTFGIMLYQEDVIRAAMAVAGYDPSRGDRLRRRLAEVRGGDAAARDAFVVAGLRRGLDARAVEGVWDEMTRFAAFSFCKAHSVTYGRIAYQCVYTKAHEPAAFMAALLSNDAGYYDKGVYVEEAKRLGIVMLPPCVQRSASACTVEKSAEREAIRVGLREVRELGEETVAAILEARAAGGPFRSLEGFHERTGASRDEIHNLILCGAFASLGESRPTLLWRLRLDRKRATRKGTGELIAGVLRPRRPPVPKLPEYDLARRTLLELEILGYSLGRHPLEVLAGVRRDTLPCGQVEDRVGCCVVVQGWLVAQRRARTRDGRTMMFLTLEDGTGVVEATLLPDRYERLAPRLQGRGPYLVHGRVESRYGGSGLRVSGLESVI